MTPPLPRLCAACRRPASDAELLEVTAVRTGVKFYVHRSSVAPSCFPDVVGNVDVHCIGDAEPLEGVGYPLATKGVHPPRQPSRHTDGLQISAPTRFFRGT